MVNKRKYLFNKAGIIVSLFFILTLFSCKKNENQWAKVNDISLNEQEALILMHYLGYDPQKNGDRKKFTQEWIDRQVFIQELSNTDEEKSHLNDLKLEWYKGELAKFEVEEKYIQTQLDTAFSDSLILDFFNQHKEDFSLNDYIVKALYIKIPKTAPKQEQLREHYLLKKDKDYLKVISYAKLYAENFYYDDSTWVYFDELTKDAPTEKLNKDNLVLNRTKTYFSDQNYVYFLNIIDFKLKDATPPLEFLKPTIEQLLISQKLNELKEKKGASFTKKLREKHEITSKY